MSLSPDGDINARAIEFALMQPPTPSLLPPQRPPPGVGDMKLIKTKYGTRTFGKFQVTWVVVLLFGVIPVAAEAGVGKAER